MGKQRLRAWSHRQSDAQAPGQPVNVSFFGKCLGRLGGNRIDPNAAVQADASSQLEHAIARCGVFQGGAGADSRLVALGRRSAEPAGADFGLVMSQAGPDRKLELGFGAARMRGMLECWLLVMGDDLVKAQARADECGCLRRALQAGMGQILNAGRHMPGEPFNAQQVPAPHFAAGGGIMPRLCQEKDVQASHQCVLWCCTPGTLKAAMADAAGRNPSRIRAIQR